MKQGYVDVVNLPPLKNDRAVKQGGLNESITTMGKLFQSRIVIYGYVDKNKRYYSENRIFVKNNRDGKEN